MLRTAAILLVGSLLAQGDGKALATLTPEQMAADLRQLASEAAAKWAYAEDRRANAGVDLEQLAEAMVARLPAVHDDATFVGLVREFVAAMQDGHAGVKWSGKEPLAFRHWPFTVVDTADGLVIDEVLPAWNDKPVALQRGDVLLAVDGVPIADVVAAAMLRTNASTAGSRRAWVLRTAAYGDGDPRRYTVKRADGDEVVAAFAAKGAPVPAHGGASAPVECRQLADGVAGIRIGTFAHHDAAAWAAAKPRERDELLAAETEAIHAAFAKAIATGARALVLDLRGNGGGTDLLGMEVAACLLPRGSVYFGLASRGWFGWSRPTPQRLPARGDPPCFAGQLVVLIDEHVFSTTDNLCRCLDDLHPDVTFVGRATGGGTGAPRPCVTLKHSGAVVTFCTMRVTGPKGELIEGRGTVPDVVVQATRAGVLAGKDEVLEAALAKVR